MTAAWNVECSGAVEFLARLPDHCAGLVLTDPPWATPTRGDVGRPGAAPLVADHPEYTATYDRRALVAAAARVLVEDGHLAVWCGWHEVSHVVDAMNDALGFGHVTVVARLIPNPAPRVRGLRDDGAGGKIGGGWVSAWDAIAVGRRAIAPSTRCMHRDYHDRLNWRSFPNPRDAAHPAAKPIELCRELVRLLSHLGDLVVDPFCGGGSILLAALAEGRRAAGCDLNPKWVATATQRLAEASRQGNLWP